MRIPNVQNLDASEPQNDWEFLYQFVSFLIVSDAKNGTILDSTKWVWGAAAERDADHMFETALIM